MLYTPSSPAFHMTPAAAVNIIEQNTCTAITKKGTRCKFSRYRNVSTCGRHFKKSECPVCYDVMELHNSHETPCGHMFHMNCINQWKNEGNSSCPMCRENISERRPQYFPLVINRQTMRVEVVEQDIQSWLRMLNLSE